MIYPTEFITVVQVHRHTNKSKVKEITIEELVADFYDGYRNVGLSLEDGIIFAEDITRYDIDSDYNYYFENDEIEEEIEKMLNSYLYADKISLLKVISPIEGFIDWFEDEYDANEYYSIEGKRNLYCSTLQSTILSLKNKFNFSEIDGEGGSFQ